MKLLFDFFPIVLFFIAYKTHGIFVATGVMIVASLVQIVWHYVQHRKFEKSHVITFLLLLVFGGLTIFLRNPEYLMWKVSVINILFALVFLGSFFVGEKTLIERMMGGQVEMPKPVWSKLNFLWTIMFMVIAAINVYFVLPAIAARDAFKLAYTLKQDESVDVLNCTENIAQNLCLNAQQTFDTWVNFKLFGTMGLTLIFVLFTVIYISKYMKETPKVIPEEK